MVNGKNLGLKGLLLLWFQVRALWLLIWWSLEAYIVVNFSTPGISRNVRKLVRTPTWIIIEKKKTINKEDRDLITNQHQYARKILLQPWIEGLFMLEKIVIYLNLCLYRYLDCYWRCGGRDDTSIFTQVLVAIQSESIGLFFSLTMLQLEMYKIWSGLFIFRYKECWGVHPTGTHLIF